MKYKFTDETGGTHTVPVGFGHAVDVAPGEEVEIFDPELGENPQFTLTGRWQPVDNEAKHAVKVAREAAAEAEPEPVEQEPVNRGESLESALIRQAAEARGIKIKTAALPTEPEVTEAAPDDPTVESDDTPSKRKAAGK